MAIHHVIHRYFIATAKTFAIVGLGAVGYMRMTILVAVADVRPAVIVVVLSGALNSIVKTLPLDIAELLRGSVPSAVMVTVLAVGGTRRCERLGDDIAGRCKGHSKYGSCKSIADHVNTSMPFGHRRVR